MNSIKSCIAFLIRLCLYVIEKYHVCLLIPDGQVAVHDNQRSYLSLSAPAYTFNVAILCALNDSGIYTSLLLSAFCYAWRDET